MLLPHRLIIACLIFAGIMPALPAQQLQLTLRYQQPVADGIPRYHRFTRDETWQASETALIICDMWDAHHCVNAVRREAEIAPRIDALAKNLRNQGATIVHAPSSCMDHYQNHPARKRAQSVLRSQLLPPDIDSWCDQIPSEEAADYPIDQSAGGEDDDPADHQQWAERLRSLGRDPGAPWRAQCASIEIDAEHDFISDSGSEIWSVLTDNKISNVILVGVHTNMCVLGRPFGLRRLAAAGKNVVLARDLTDTMVDPKAWPYANHFTGTDLILGHIERYVCPTFSSDQILGGSAHRFSADDRPRLVMLIAEDEYKTEATLPAFAAKHLSQHFSVTTCFGSETEREKIIGIEAVAAADALLISVRRRPLPAADLALIRAFAASGKPMIGIRTASHAFSLRNNEPAEGLDVWPEFDAQIWGGGYTNHYGNDLKSKLIVNDSVRSHPILASAAVTGDLIPGGSLYKTSPLQPGSQLLLSGSVPDQQQLEQQPEPVAWTFIRSDGGRSFYTSLGHVDDFTQSQFEALLSAGIHWACGLPPHSYQEIQQQNQRYAAGRGKQRR